MKKFLSKLVMVVLILTMSIGISSVAYAYDDADIISVNEQYLDSWNSSDFNSYLEDESIDETSLEKFTTWQAIKDELGSFIGIDGTVVSEADGVITAITTANYENNKLTFTLTYDSATVESYGAMYAVMSVDAVNASSSNAGTPNMAKAGMNTLMGMGIVFIVLIVISLVISLLKYIPDIIDKLTKSRKETSKESQTIENVVSINESKEESLMDDSELVAVITAAIMAAESETIQKGGLVVRSIRRRR